MGTRITEIAKKPSGAHYLHGKSGLEPVLRVPVSDPRALCWVPRKELLMVATVGGDLVEVDPVMGTRTRNTIGGEAQKLSLDPTGRKYVAVRVDGQWCAGTLGSAPDYEGTHQFHKVVSAFYQGAFMVLLGEVDSGRAVSIIKDGKELRRISLPGGTTVYPGQDGKIWYARSTHRGVECGRLGAKTRFSEWEPTQHGLATNGVQMVGWTEYGAVVWNLADKASSSFGLLDLNVGAIRKDGDWVCLGTVGGVVALVDIRTAASRNKPYLTKAHDAPIHSVCFSDRGQWFATAADRVQLWSWEASEAPSEK